ncbi:inositol phosphosphingolipid phospholipase C [Rhizoctonia solani AG-3 Rhs1AP]|uniref:Inositol phosphosphingolipid phospholipase C n=2 Tax=Rhizoctonia solani AG-3 TaxID=1086053 RepID=A0A074RYU2_9AGAM|nr:inositol phosphosphingolipid phospholipase C [Rhizoctonia solani AG-3 Rhs1AP]KEP52169.1 inositol phosphosphingolipid phospholipase C [Rhizoctonia solani 123E]
MAEITEPSTMDTKLNDSELRVLTLNCWGLKFGSKDRIVRARAIGDEIAASKYDIVGLQELQVQEDYDYIKSKLAYKLPYSKYFLSGALGAGLAIFSRFPIQSTSLLPYSLCGSPLDIAEGNWFGGKAVVSAIIDHPLLGEVEIFNTHLYAKGGESPSKPQMAHRLVGAYEFTHRVNTSASLGRQVLALGDFNCISRNPAMQFIYTMTSLKDAWGSTHGSFIFPQAEGVHSPYHAVNDHGVTTHSPLNTYTNGKELDEHARKFQGKRLDYILFRPPRTRSSRYTHELRCRESSVVFTHHIPGTEISFSDHFGVAAMFECVPVHRNVQNGRRPITPPRGTTYSPATRSEIIEYAISTMSVAYNAARWDKHKKLVSFAMLVVLLVVLIIGSAWVPRPYFNPALMFASAAIAWSGTTLLYAALLGGGWETRTLMRTMEELELMLQVEERKAY